MMRVVWIVESGDGSDGDEYRVEAVFATEDAANAWAIEEDRKHFKLSSGWTWREHVGYAHRPDHGEFGYYSVSEWEVQ